MREERKGGWRTAIAVTALLAALAMAAPAGGEVPNEGAAGATMPEFTRPPAFSPVRFRNRAARGTAASYLVFTISETAELKLHFTHARPGRRAHGRCVAPSHANRTNRRCTRWVDVGTTSGHALAGDDKIPFAPSIGGHLLAPGSYRVSITATDAAGNSSAPATAGFTITP